MTRLFTYYNIVATLLLLLFATASCSTRSSGDKPVVAVSIAPQQYIVEQIGGDRIDVRTILGAGANPETFEPSMAHLMDLENSTLYLQIGNLGFEEAITAKIRDANPDLKLINMSEGVELLEGTHGHGHGDGHEHSHEFDPHTWSSVANVRLMADNTLKALSEIDPEGTSVYQENHARFIAKLDSIDNVVRQKVEGAVASGHGTFMVWHPSLSYFARDYGLEQIALGSENKELAAPVLRAKIDEARSKGATVLLMQRDFDSRQAEVICRETGAKIKYINPLNPDWASEIISTAESINNY